MSGFYSVRPRVWPGKRKAYAPVGPGPYERGSDAYAERHTSHETDLGNGLVRVDLGEPLRRLPGETQPVRKHTPKVTQAAPAVPPSASPAVSLRAPAARKREHRAITRDP